MIALALLLLLAAPPPLACPKGAERRGAAPPEGFAEWCEGKDVAGRPRREGPSRTYYDDGGLWVEERWSEGERDGPFVEWPHALRVWRWRDQRGHGPCEHRRACPAPVP